MMASAPNFSSSDHERGNPVSLGAKQQLPRSNRTQLSCTNCRQSKLKCDRFQPCARCKENGKGSLCTLPTRAIKKQPYESLKNRLRHLENLVKDAMTDQPHAIEHLPPASEINRENVIASTWILGDNGAALKINSKCCVLPTRDLITEDLSPSGRVFYGMSQTTYVGATHWTAILDDIEEMNTCIRETEAVEANFDEINRLNSSLVLSVDFPATQRDLLTALPQQAVVDRLISRYFNSNSPGLHIIHRPTFLKEYSKFWANPSGTTVSWLALLYSLMALAAFTAYGAGEGNFDLRGTQMEMIQNYRHCCKKCLILTNCFTPRPYTIETLLMHIEGEFVMNKGDHGQGYLLIGDTVRLALRMGLHRDPDKLGMKFTPFQGELRRRAWHLLVQVDLLASFHIGLPGMVQAIESDTSYPRNLRDEDFDDESTELPPSMPESEMTGMSYTICKGRICHVLGKIVTQANMLSLPANDDIIELDRLLCDAEANIPHFFCMRSLELSITDSPELIIRRFSLALLVQKCRCMLHRNHMTIEGDSRAFAYSKKAGLEGAMELLSYQSLIYEAALDGGPLSRDRWFLCSVNLHDFLLAAMMLFLNVVQLLKRNMTDQIDHSNTSTPSFQDMIAALRGSYSVWVDTQPMSADVKKASRVLGIMLTKINDFEGHKVIDKFNQNVNFGQTFNDNLPQQGASMSASSYFDPGLESTSMQMDPLEAMIDMPTNFDWNLFDNQIWPGPQQFSDQIEENLNLSNFSFDNNHY